VTTPAFLTLWGLASLRDLPDLDRLEDAGLLGKPPLPEELRGALGIKDDDEDDEDGASIALPRPALPNPAATGITAPALHCTEMPRHVRQALTSRASLDTHCGARDERCGLRSCVASAFDLLLVAILLV
jgi:hypothetical protein